MNDLVDMKMCSFICACCVHWEFCIKYLEAQDVDTYERRIRGRIRFGGQPPVPYSLTTGKSMERRKDPDLGEMVSLMKRDGSLKADMG